MPFEKPSETVDAAYAVKEIQRLMPDAFNRLFPEISLVRCYRERDLLKLVPISRSKFSEMCRQGSGPRAVRVGTAKLFREIDVVEWLMKMYSDGDGSGLNETID